MADVTHILSQIERGDADAAGRLLPLVYDELRRLASALVHEAFVRLVAAGQQQQWNSRGHFFAAAAEAMRRILVENARRKGRRKHGGRMQRVDLDDRSLADTSPPDDPLALDEALDKLAAEEPLKAKVVELRFFAGMSTEETARALGVFEPTVKRHWRYARAWLRREVGAEGE